MFCSWCGSFPKRFCLSARGQRGWAHWLCVLSSEELQGRSKGDGAMLSRAEPWRMRGLQRCPHETLPQIGVWSNLWCYPLTSWYKVSMTLCSETASFINLWANDSNFSLNGTATAWVLPPVHILFLVFDWQTVYCLVSQRYDLDFALGWRHCRRFWLFGSKNL